MNQKNEKNHFTGRRILRLPAVMAQTGMGRSWIYKEAAAQRFPQPIKIGRASGWDAAAIDAWVGDRLLGAYSAEISTSRGAGARTRGTAND